MELPPDKQAQFDQFKLIVGLETPENDTKVAQLLDLHHYDLNNAISVYFDSQFETLGDTPAPPPSPPADAPVADTRQVTNLHQQMFFDEFIPRLPKAPRIANHWQIEVGIHRSVAEHKPLPLKERTTLWILLLILPQKLFQLIFSALKYFFGLNMVTASLASFPRKFDFSQAEDGDGDRQALVLEKDADEYNLRFAGFNECHDTTRSECTWLLVIFINNEDASRQFLDNMLHHTTFAQLFNKNSGTYKDTLIYINNVERDPEAYEIGCTYAVKKLPYVMLIGNVSPNPQQTLNSMSIVYKSNLGVSPESVGLISRKVLRNIGNLMDKYGPQLLTYKLDQQEIEFARRIKQQQDDAYQDSLLRDQIKKTQKNEKLYKTWYLLTLLESDFASTVTSAESKLRLAIKLPHGVRLVDKFVPTISVNDVYMYIELKLYWNKLAAEHGLEGDELAAKIPELIAAVSLSDDLKHPIDVAEYFSRYGCKFELVQPFPKRVVERDECGVGSVDELRSGANLLVEWVELEDEEEEE